MIVRPTHQRRTAFTIIEIIIAAAILGVIVIAIYSAWESILRATRIGNAAADRIQRERIARDSIQRALNSILVFPENQEFYSFIAETEDEKYALLSFTSYLPPDFPGSGFFLGERVRRVSFEVEPDGAHGLPDLVMHQERLMDEQEEDERKSVPIVLLTNLGLFQIEFWNTNSGEWEYEWLDTNSVPPMMRLILGFNGDEEENVFTSVVGANATPVPREVHAWLNRGGGPQRNRQPPASRFKKPGG